MEKIVRVAENNVEVRTVYFDKKTDGEEVVVSKESYGNERITLELKRAKELLTSLDNFNTLAAKAKVQKRIDRLNNIQAIMEA